MHQQFQRTSLFAAVGIGLVLTTITAGFTVAVTPATARNQKVSNSPTLLAQTTPTVNQTQILADHNKYRQEVGTPGLKWSTSLASSAQNWANQLAATGQFKHSNSGNGENLWAGTAGAFTQTKMIDSWGSEKKNFIYGTFPNVSKTGKWQDVGHYTQIIWRNTTEVGCGLARGQGRDYFVCQYKPAGNVIGQKPY
jgi:hypothetical protein